jgi:hypothetical protein
MLSVSNPFSTKTNLKLQISEKRLKTLRINWIFLPRIVSWQTKETIDCAVEIADLFFG